MDDKVFDELMDSVDEAIGHQKGERKLRTYYGDANTVKRARLSTGLNQDTFAQTFDINPRTLQAWERKDEEKLPGYVKSLMTLIQDDPNRAQRVVSTEEHEPA
ncbi:MAG: hypothetical protein AAF141_05825 [Pseudomonadota bacterium]